MEMVNAGLLYLLPLAAIPVVLHLLTLHRLRTVELSTYRFLFDTYVQQRRQVKFLEALLAFLRTLFLLLLIAICARPVVRHWSALFGGGAGRDVIMLVDCSASMNAQTDGRSALDRAKRAAWSVAERLSPEDRLTLVKVASTPQEVFSRFSPAADTVREQIEGLQASPARGNWLAALAQLAQARGRQATPPTIYLLTDAQATGWREAATQGADRLIPDEARVVLVKVGSNAPLENRAVTGMPPREHRAIVGLPLTLRPRVRNDSATEMVDVAVGVFIDEEEIARVPLTIKPGDTAEKEIIYVPTEPGVRRCRFEIHEDRFPDDDRFLFTLAVSPPIKVLLVNGHPANDPFENEGLYLRTALTAHGEEDESPASPLDQVHSASADQEAAGLAPSKEYVQSLEVEEIQERQLDAERLRNASVAILANCGGLNQQHFNLLHDFVSAGGGLAIFPGDRVNADQYNKQLLTVPGPLNERLVPVEMKQPVGDLQKPETFAQFAGVDFSHPMLSVFDDPDARYLATSNFYRRFPLQLSNSAGGWVLAKFSATEAALVESRFRDGRVMLAAFPAHARWTNLSLKPEFVPLLLRMVNRLERRSALETPSVVPADGVAEVSVAAEWAPVEGKITDVQRRVSDLTFTRTGSHWVAAYEATALKGYYRVDVKGGRVEQPKRGETSFAVNLAPEESEFAALDEQELADLFPGVKLSVVDATAETEQELGSIGNEREIWRYLLFFVFVVIAAEFLLATMSGRNRNDDVSLAQRVRQMTPGAWVGQMTGANDSSITE
ncbi:MAG TPA: vWA domain-containing protein [Pirellulales bacterium]|nr:vWA domain-containing protein [Pirellulales bacterium]